MSFQAIAKSTNRLSLVIGEISAAEAEIAKHESPFIDGKGIYLIAVDHEAEDGIGDVLAKFTSENAAHHLANFFRFSGRLETV